MAKFSKFYLKTPQERLNLLQENDWIPVEVPQLDSTIANQMIENYVFNYQLPLGLAPNFVIDSQEYVLPMVTEEPSVIAAASLAGKILGDIQTRIISRELVGQVVIPQVTNPDAIIEKLEAIADFLLDIAARNCPNMVARGGGLRKIWFKKFRDQTDYFVTIYIALDPCDAMGANVMNTVLENITPTIEHVTGYPALMSILSNHGTHALFAAECQIPLDRLNADPQLALAIANQIEQASRYAMIDPYRAVTHNKGIMNGIDALVLATGNDTRAVEAGVHAHASRSGRYQALTQWTYDEKTKQLLGKIELPLMLGSVGGTISIHPIARWSLSLLKQPDAKTLSRIVAALGLAQNFAAIRALVTEGIQKGHMTMQARSLALQVGAEIDEVPLLVQELSQHKAINSSLAKELLIKIRAK
ncbi:hydroxymethylglutaryl-CoA reductase, degradative [Vaginisenegalia massiliensis]|uniref:hydroxymethylglutaryl-CoA reductase, degradative n=1 Tax=Vaginisenegalia massiliensis TaxID=2058294 RepID=UPI000F5405B1|nr:hydroxymethylglutaryl-CoA reductase, degradative [Vaginisenegalia massiliensis]